MRSYRITFILPLLCLCTALFSQSTRMNAYLIKALAKDATQSYAVLVKGNVSYIKQFTESHQGLFKYNCGEICSIVLKGTDIQLLAKTKQVSRMEYYEAGHVRPLDDTSIIKNNLLKIHNGQTPLPQAYDGTGVTFGLVDTGIEWRHPDFTDSTTGKTRIKWIWDQNHAIAANTPQPYNYGQEWDNTKIDSGLCPHNDFYDVGHGTKVAGIAAGNGNTNAIYKGHAPKTDIICVALNFSSPGPVVLDGINYLVSKANAMGQPFVLNLSIGDYYGSHDGLDLQAQAIDAMFANVPGRCAVAAAGNAGNYPFHLKYNLGTDTNFTFIQTTAAASQFLAYADTNTFKLSKYSIGVYNPTTLEYIGNIGFRGINSCLGTLITDTLKNSNGDRIGYVETAGDIIGSSYELYIGISMDSTSYLWTWENTGTGFLDAWNFDFVSSGLPTVGTLPRMQYYKRGDTLQTICTSFQCSDEVITVVNYTTRTGHVTCNQVFVTDAGPYDTLLFYASKGPTRDLRQKPDIASTGDNILTTGMLFLCDYIAVNFTSPQNDIVTEDTMHMGFSGTSSSCPAVAGFVALYLQKNPTATSTQIRNAITGCAKVDYFTGTNLPNTHWGYGKLDGYNAMLCGTSSVQTLTQEELRVFPNPGHSEINFAFANEPGEIDLKLYSLLGAEIKSVRTSQKNLSLYIGNLPQGLYLYKISKENTLLGEGKFIKE